VRHGNPVLSALRIARPAAWERIVRAEIAKAQGNLANAAKAMMIARNTLSLWCRQIGLPKKGKEKA
jgi:DNA-binding NtrC family response regulator